MFRLSRYFSIASLIGILAIVVALSLFLRELAIQELLAQQTRSNADLTRSYGNAIWGQFDDFVAASEGWSGDELRQRPELDHLHRLTLAQMKGMSVVKVKVYNLKGMTVFSTEAKQIGEDKSGSPGFQAARGGETASEITFRNQFHGLEGALVDRNLVASYIPIRERNGGPVKAVFEVYADVTPLLEQTKSTQTKLVVAVAASLAVLYLFLHFIVRRADRILVRQEEQRQSSEARIRHQAYHDSLTGLPNRNSFNERIREATARAHRHHTAGALLFLDLDRFKLVNDSLGHNAGDQLLRVTASRIVKSLREADTAFRLSGDEFVVILEDLDKPECAALSAQRILNAMEAPVPLGATEVIVNASIGIAHFPREHHDADALLKEADLAMYRAKQTGPNQYEFYTQEMNPVAHERLAMETDLQRALQNGEFLLHYQPKVETATRELVSVEALLRWNHPKKGLVRPDVFIPLLEEIGLINAVGDWVLREATRQAQAWVDAGLAPVRMSVNISGRQFRSAGLIESVQHALDTSGLEARHLELELTESMFVENTERAIKTMESLKRLGVFLSIDDFGAGYSSFAYLKQFPVDYLKIDRTFIRDLTTNEQDAAIVVAIATLAASLHLKVVAEGVETAEQAAFLERQGCHELQGFYFGRPMEPARLEDMLRQRRRR